MSERPPKSPGLPFIFVTLLLDTIGLGIIIPIVPAFVTQLVGSPLAAAHYLGWLIAAFSLAQLLTAPLLGALSDRYGRRPVLLISTLVAALSYVFAAFAPTMGWLLAARAIGGIGGATIGVAYAYIADVTAPAARARAFGLAGAAFGLGLIIGPALGGLLGQYAITWPFLAAALLAFVNFLYGLFILPESHQPSDQRISISQLIPLRALGILGRFPGLPLLAVLVVCMNLAQQFLTSTWILHGTLRYGWNSGMNGASLAIAGVVSAIVQAIILPPVLKKLGNERTIFLGFAIGVIGNVLYGFAAQPWMLFASMLFASLAGLAPPAVKALVAGHTPAQAQGAVQGAIGGLGSLCAIFGPLAATAVFARFASAESMPYLPGIAFFISAGIILVGLVIIIVSGLGKSKMNDLSPTGTVPTEIG